MLTGKNTNVVYNGKVYHVQTEDSGINRPYIITLLYQGGTIISSKKTSYSDIVTSDHREEIVGKIIDEQHNQMIETLKSGAFDLPGGPGKKANTTALNPLAHKK